MLEWQVVPFKALDTTTLYNLLKLRVDVFVVEQNCPYPELDDKDLHEGTLHIFLKKDQKVLAYSRVLAPGVSYDHVPAIGRVCVSQTARRLGLGEALVAQAIATCQSHVAWYRYLYFRAMLFAKILRSHGFCRRQRAVFGR